MSNKTAIIVIYIVNVCISFGKQYIQEITDDNDPYHYSYVYQDNRLSFNFPSSCVLMPNDKRLHNVWIIRHVASDSSILFYLDSRIDHINLKEKFPIPKGLCPDRDSIEGISYKIQWDNNTFIKSNTVSKTPYIVASGKNLLHNTNQTNADHIICNIYQFEKQGRYISAILVTELNKYLVAKQNIEHAIYKIVDSLKINDVDGQINTD